ncbi:MAG: hypothetical protein ACREQ5_11375 [Candidatus Dormibacteria bacterium]
MNDPRTEGVRGSDESVATAGRPAHDIPHPRHSDVPAQLRRRRAASWRCPPLAGGRRDPWDDPHPDHWTEHEVDSWSTSMKHLAAAGLPGLLPPSALVAVQRRRPATCRGEAA